MYKLIKEYPGYAIEIGDKVCYSNRKHDPGWVNQRTNCTVYGFPGDYPEFWEKVEELDYEILSFKLKSEFDDLIRFKNKFGMFPSGDRCESSENRLNEFSEDNLLSDKDYNIHSIKRLSDNEVFTIGDKIDSNYKKHIEFSTIDKIEIHNSKVRIKYQGDMMQFEHLNSMKKYKFPLFTTEDGVEIFEGDKYYYASKNFEFNSFVGNKQSGKNLNYKYFSTKEAAQTYIDENKPKYSEKDMISFGKDIQSRFVKPTWPVIEFFKTWKGKNE